MPESEKPTETIWQKSANIAQVIYIVVGFVVLGGGWAWNQQNAIARLSMQQESQSREFSEFKADVQRQLTRITEKFESFGKDVTEVVARPPLSTQNWTRFRGNNYERTEGGYPAYRPIHAVFVVA